MDLESLSDDLLLEIMELVADSVTKAHHLYERRLRNNDLLSLMRCSRRLYRLGEPILYRKLIQTTSKALPRFIKTILAHPNLVDHVRSVILTDRGPAKPPDVVDGPPSSTGDVGARDMIDIPREVRIADFFSSYERQFRDSQGSQHRVADKAVKPFRITERFAFRSMCSDS